MMHVNENISMSQVATSRVVTSVFEQILAAVHRGELKPGQRISDAELADEFGVSRTPVREALQRLREIGIVEASPSRFTRISDVTSRQVLEALVVWVALYGAVIDETVPDADPAWADEMEQLHNDFKAAMVATDGEALATSNFFFYSVLVRNSANQALQRAITGVVHIVRLGSLYLPEFIDMEALADAQHHLINAVRTRDVSLARASLDIISAIRVPSA